MATRIAMTVDHDDICNDGENRYGKENHNDNKKCDDDHGPG